MKILFIGDIVARLGRNTVKKVLPGLIKGDNINLVIANAENLAHGRGATEGTINETIGYGVNAFTGGDHIFHLKEFEFYIEKLPVIRPANFFEPCPGVGYKKIEVIGIKPILIVNLQGDTFARPNVKNPFHTIDQVLEEFNKSDLSGIIVDIHGDLTSEKVAMGHYLDGRVSAVVGTHTHIPTADNRVSAKGTAYVTDVGMVGAQNSILGVEKSIIIERFLSSTRKKFEWVESGPALFNSVLIDINENTAKAKNIERRDFEV